MKKLLFLFGCLLVPMLSHAETWERLWSVFSPTSLYRESDGYRLGYLTGAPLVSGSIDCDTVYRIIDPLYRGYWDDGWYYGTKNNDDYGELKVGAFHSSLEDWLKLDYPKEAGGAFAACKCEMLEKATLDPYEKLRVSFRTGSTLDNTSETGQTYNFGLWYWTKFESGACLVEQIGGSMISKTAAELIDQEISWEISRSEYDNLFDHGGRLCLILNSTDGKEDQYVEFSCFKVEGLLIPEPSSTSVLLVGLGGLLLRRKRR